MKYHIFWEKNKKNVMNFSSAEFLVTYTEMNFMTC